VIVNDNGLDLINRFRVEERVDSDHMSLSVEIKEDGARIEEEEQKEDRKMEREWNTRICWNEEAIKQYEERTEEQI